MIRVAHLTRRFGSLVALDDLSFEIESGEVVGFLGPNGAGKTTTLRILAGYLPATSGAASVAGFDVLRQSLEVRRRIGYLPESVPLYREHRVVEMMRFQAALHGMPRALARRRIPEVLERVGVLDRERDLIGGLSRGLRQRVALAVALLPDPQVLILDEPASGLDPLQRIEVRGILRDLASKRTVLLSSHILPEIEATCPRVIIVHKGRIAADGTPDQLVARLGGRSHVHLEAATGRDREKPVRLLRGIAGVRAVNERGRLGVHDVFDLDCDGDLREDVGALAAHQGWALRELSWRSPTLEELFARIALDLDDETAAPATSARVEPGRSPASSAPVDLGSSSTTSARASTGSSPHAPAGRTIYSLNPFDQGASRDLGKPKPADMPVTIAPPSNPTDRAADRKGGACGPETSSG